MTDLPLADVIDLIIRGFAHLEQGVHPVELGAVGPVRYLRWPERGRRGGRFTEEFFALDLDPAVVLAAVRQIDPGPHHLISDIHATRGPAISAYSVAGYVTNYREPVMILDLATLSPPPVADPIVQQVTDLGQADRIQAALAAAGAGLRLTSQRQIDDPLTVINVITIEGEPACTGKGILIDDALYVTEIATLPAYRKRGLAGVLLTALHAGAREAGARWSVLTATAMAAPLYSRFGYREVAIMDIFAPVTP